MGMIIDSNKKIKIEEKKKFNEINYEDEDKTRTNTIPIA